MQVWIERIHWNSLCFSSEMPFSHFRMLVPSPFDCCPDTALSPLLYYMVYRTQFPAFTRLPSNPLSLVKNKSQTSGLVGPSIRMHGSRSLYAVDIEETSADLGEFREQNHSIYSSEDQSLADKIQLDSFSNGAESYIDEDEKESLRRIRIGIANKGRTPWNKGRKHSPETRERIRQRTKEALMNPKVRKKLSERQRAHSDQTKTKIGSALRQKWEERLKWKRSRERLFSLWAEGIAEAAKTGGRGEKELDWDSYDKLKDAIALQQHKWASKQAKAKEKVRIQAAKQKEKRIARRAQKKIQQEQAQVKIKTRKSKEEKEESAIAEGLRLKERLTKIHRKKSSANGQIASEDLRTWKKIDLEFVMEERKRREISLADQIRAAKSKKVKSATNGSTSSSYSLKTLEREL